jgi:xanthine dehydrogenase iron-sulfur cluster and FAD-binding subunit A
MKIIGGNTEVGIETKFGFFNKNFEYSTMVAPNFVQELCKITEDKEGFHIGCGIRLETFLINS